MLVVMAVSLLLGLGGAVLLPVAAVLALLGWGFTREPRYIPSPLVAKEAAPFTLRRFDGGTLSLADLRGQVIFLNFWASWCPPCRAEARTLEAAWRRYRDQGIVFVGVNIQDKEPDARAFLEEFGVTYPNVIDEGSKVAIEYGIWGIPETFFIDPEGRVTYKHVGALGWSTITAKLDEALRGVVSAAEGRGDFRPVQWSAPARRKDGDVHWLTRRTADPGGGRRRRLLAAAGAAVAAAAVGWASWRSGDERRGYRDVVRWRTGSGEGRFVAVPATSSLADIRAVGAALREEFTGTASAVVMVFDSAEAARVVRRGSRVVGAARFREALARQRAMFVKQSARGEHRLVIHEAYPEIREVIRYPTAMDSGPESGFSSPA